MCCKVALCYLFVDFIRVLQTDSHILNINLPMADGREGPLGPSRLLPVYRSAQQF